MFLWYIEWAAKDRHHEIGVPDSESWQARLIAEALGETSQPQPARETEDKPPLKRAG